MEYTFNLIPSAKSDGLIYVYGWQSVYDMAVKMSDRTKRMWTAEELWALFILENKRQAIQ
jgi:hypothetical protein